MPRLSKEQLYAILEIHSKMQDNFQTWIKKIAKVNRSTLSTICSYSKISAVARDLRKLLQYPVHVQCL